MDFNLFKDKILKRPDGIWEVEGLPKGEYDGQAVKYDKLVSNPTYNKIMWGNKPKAYADFAKEGLLQHKNGVVADIGCGSLSFTAKVYAESSGQELFLCDLSEEMLKIGKKRVELFPGANNNITFLRADAFSMPFTDSAVQTLFCFGIFHIFENPQDLLNECHRILKPGGRLLLTSLCTERKLSAWYLKLLQKKGHVATPLSAGEVRDRTEKAGFEIAESRVKGGMVYLIAKKREIKFL